MSDGSIIVSSKSGLLLRYDNTGKLLWKKALTHPLDGNDIDWNDNVGNIATIP